jgi:nucleotide-binding universal stress UspA family protein
MNSVTEFSASYGGPVMLGIVSGDNVANQAPGAGRWSARQDGAVDGRGMRPLLVVPYDWAPGPLGERVLVAWDASREAARAVNDALPILEQAASVLVVSINPKSTPLGHGELPGADIALHLARHDIDVEVQSIEVDQMEVGEALLSFASDGSRDLLVMGAYAHSRIRELVLGGVTRAVLAHMTLPVLMAH